MSAKAYETQPVYTDTNPIAVSFDYSPQVNYMETMIKCASKNDIVWGTAAAKARNEKIADLGTNTAYKPISFEDLHLLSKVMYAEAGSEWLSDDWKMAVGEVILNRRDSPEFPNTISDVIYQHGQYYSKTSRYFQDIMPSERCVMLAVRLLEGERVFNDPSVVFQANFPQGSGVHAWYWDKHLGTTYFCYSNYPNKYVWG
jgi:Cell wall hydrolyses involved in spore germination